VLAVTDSVMGTWSYSYDDFNRLTNGNATAEVDSGIFLGWTYDRFDNRSGAERHRLGQCVGSVAAVAFQREQQ
jgi:hypothetical protein